jgi:hypothetical protein
MYLDAGTASILWYSETPRWLCEPRIRGVNIVIVRAADPTAGNHPASHRSTVLPSGKSGDI